MLEKVLVCLDGSGLAEQSLPVIIEPCLLYKSEIILFRVTSANITIPPPLTVHISSITRSIDPQPGPVADLTGDPPVTLEPRVGAQLDEISRDQAEAREYLEGLAQPLRGQGLRIKTAVLQGVPAEEILKYAAGNKITLIAMTSQGLGGRKKRTLGRVVQTVLKESRIPVVVIKPK